MLKNKERRDTILLAFMGIITLLFLLYIFIPSGDSGEKKNGNNGTNGKQNNNGKTTKPPEKIKLPKDYQSAEKLKQMNLEVKKQLIALHNVIVSSPEPFTNYATEGLKKLPALFKSKLVDRLYTFSFNDLKKFDSYEFPKSYGEPLKFNLFLSVFLLKLQEEGIENKISGLPWDEFTRQVDFTCYQLLKNEIEEDYQCLPVLFYFKQLAKRVNVYPWMDMTSFFKKSAENLQDRSHSKYLEEIRGLLFFSQQTDQYRLEWRERDGLLDGDDKKQYPKTAMRTFNFLKQEYLVLPDDIDPVKNQWLEDLLKSDPGEIELIRLSIQNINPTRGAYLRKIIYTPVNPRFVAVLNEHKPDASGGFLERMIYRCRNRFHKSYTVIPFAPEETSEDALEKALIEFGRYLKKNKQSID